MKNTYSLKKPGYGLLFFISTLLLGAASQAEPVLADRPEHYYGEELRTIENSLLKDELHRILTSGHIATNNGFDQIVSHCHGDNSENCYQHRSHSYKVARQYMFGQLYLKENSNRQYFLNSVYCDTLITNEDLPPSMALGPMKIPNSQILNAEHAWPQSKFSSQYPKGFQKSDLHSLYPVRMKVNSTRSNHPFGEVVNIKDTPCQSALLGHNSQGQLVFEPSDNIKGNIARSLFYFSIRYDIAIDPTQEQVLRNWHHQDPVDWEELEKHEEIFHIQYVRNPFVDNPEWVESIKNF